MTLKELKIKYSGQIIPAWELERLNDEAAQSSLPTDAPRRRGRPPKPREVIDGDGDAD